MNKIFPIIAAILISNLIFGSLYAQDSSESVKEETLFRSAEIIGNDGVESYLISLRSQVSGDSVLTDLVGAFGSFDYKSGKNTYVWENFSQNDWHEDPFILEIVIANIYQSDGKTPTGMVWITVGAETEGDLQLLKPGTKSFDKMISFFDGVVAKRLLGNN